CWSRQQDAWDTDYGGMAPVEARAVADAARSSAPFSQPFEMQREKITRLCNRVLGRRGIRRIPLPLAAGIVEAVGCAAVERDRNVAAEFAAALDERRASGRGGFLVGGAVKHLHRRVGEVAVLVELTLQRARRIENQRGGKPRPRVGMLDA